MLSYLAVSPSKLKAAHGRGASIARARKKPVKPAGASVSYRDSEQAKTTFTVLSLRGGFRVGGKCAARAPRHHTGKLKRCTREVNVGTFTHADAAGANRFKFTGRAAGRALGSGRYLLRAVARNAAGQSSRPLTVSFRAVG